MKICVYGGLFGSEGKGCVSEWFAKNKRTPNTKLVVFGENSPNSGHTCSAGKTQNIPACSYFADCVVLGPDAVIDVDVLLDDLERVTNWRNTNNYGELAIYVHEHCGLIFDGDRELEKEVVGRISSTGSGSGAARVCKSFHREADRIVVRDTETFERLAKAGIRFLNRFQWFTFLASVRTEDWIFECSQGALLDTNWGYYPSVTSRTTLPRTAIDRNGLSGFTWEYAGVYRSFPIRTGGPSGITGGEELEWSQLGVTPEIASVTKRVRRVFNPSSDDMFLSLALTMPHYLFMTHCDYIGGGQWDMERPDLLVEVFIEHMEEWMLTFNPYPSKELYISAKPGQFLFVPLSAVQVEYTPV